MASFAARANWLSSAGAAGSAWGRSFDRHRFSLFGRALDLGRSPVAPVPIAVGIDHDPREPSPTVRFAANVGPIVRRESLDVGIVHQILRVGWLTGETVRGAVKAR